MKELSKKIPSGMQLRRRFTSAAIDGKTEGYEELKLQIQKPEEGNLDMGIYRLLKGLQRFDVPHYLCSFVLMKTTMTMTMIKWKRS